MRISIVNSAKDPAGCHIREELLKMTGHLGEGAFRYFTHDIVFLETEERLIYEDNLDVRTDCDLIIFISRHTSVNPAPALTVHVTGNFKTADYGGEPDSLAMAAPEWMQRTLNMLRKYAPKGYSVSYEVTHHGPTDLKTPSFFVEIGSTEKEWADKDAASAVAGSLLEVLKEDSPEVIRLIGFGGNHYAARETEIALSSNAGFGHICHSREVPDADKETVIRMVKYSGAQAAYIDKKSVPKSDLRRIEKILKDLNLPLLSEGEVISAGELDWETFLEIREMADEVKGAGKVKIMAISGKGELFRFGIDADLFEEALRADKSAVVKSLQKLPVACITSLSGNLLPEFISYKENRLKLINDLITLCVKTLHKEEFTVTDNDRIIIRKVRFDPDAAKKAGVPPGPLYGRLAAGNEIIIEGRKITPEMVSAVDEKIIHLEGLERYL